MRRKNTPAIHEKGFSLLELLLVIVISSVIAATVYIKFRPDFDSGSAERTIEAVAEKVAGRRDEAIRLNGLAAAATSLEAQVAPLVEIDFLDPATTASLIIDGDDGNSDYFDDDTGEFLTHLNGSGWKYSYRGDALKLPAAWRVVAKSDMSVAPINDRGRGVPVTRIGFDAAGHVYGYADDTWQKYPADSSTEQQYSPFWTIYLEGSGRDQNAPALAVAVAVAVHPSGQIEKFRFDGSRWRGWRGRTIE